MIPMKKKEVIQYIVSWLNEYADASATDGFVVGLSGGIDSALVSTLCAMTRKTTLVLEMPIHQAPSEVNRAKEHIAWLKNKFPNVESIGVDLTPTFETLKGVISADADPEKLELSLANTRARLRMTTLYYYAGIRNLLVAGTGNKVEDFGIGFFTKFGDGAADLSPIADLYKTEVYALSRELNFVESILNAIPTDGLFGDSRTDEDQIGASYPELEWAMEYLKTTDTSEGDNLTERQKAILTIYKKRRKANHHKMVPIPMCTIPSELR